MYNCQRCRCTVGPCVAEHHIVHYRQVVDAETGQTRSEISQEERVCSDCWRNQNLPEFLHLTNGQVSTPLPVGRKTRKAKRQPPQPDSRPGKYHWRKNWIE